MADKNQPMRRRDGDGRTHYIIYDVLAREEDSSRNLLAQKRDAQK